MSKKGKKYTKVYSLVDKTKQYSLEEGIKLACKTSITSFVSSLDISVRLNVDPRKEGEAVRGSVIYPHGVGKVIRILVLTDRVEEAKSSGADYAGVDDYIQKLESGWTDIDVIIATPNIMPKIAKLGRFLGPRGLMPNPRSGTVTDDIVTAISEIKKGKIEFRVDKNGIIHASIGRTNFEVKKLKENAIALLSAVVNAKPATAKGTYINSLFLSSTMGPSIAINYSDRY